MLNELALVRKGIAELDPNLLPRKHQSLSGPGKTNVLRVVLASELNYGCIAELDYLQGEKHKKYWTQGDGNQNRFPAVKLTFPLRPGGVMEYKQWKQANKEPLAESHLSCLRRLRSRYPVDLSSQEVWPKYRSKLERRFDDYRDNLSCESRIVADLLSKFLSIKDNGLDLLRGLDEKLWQQCESTADKALLDLAALIMFARLVGDETLSDNGEMPTRPTLLFDFASDGFSAANKHWIPAISAAMFQMEKAQGNQRRVGSCAISGKQNSVLVLSTFPPQECEHLGKVTIYSRKKGVPTYRRYNKEAAESMAVSTELADELASALCYLNTKARGTTWDVIPGETGRGDLLLSFCRALPGVNAARLLSYSSDLLEDEDDYESEAKQVCDLFKGVDAEVMAQVDFLIIKKVNDGVQKAIFSSSQSLIDLESAASNWCQANKNTPAITLLLKDKQKSYRPPFTISPKQFALLFKKQYARDAELKLLSISGVPFAEVMALFLNESKSAEFAGRQLNRLLRQYSGLLELVALKRTNPVKHHKDALCVITAIGLLLYKLDRTKEMYMNELAYKLGQFCAALDEIHIGYCESERKGDLPNRLIGNQAYAAAVSSPLKALQITAQRAAVYQAWAKKVSMRSDEKTQNEQIINAKYAFLWMRNHCAELHDLIPQKLSQPTSESRAELLLGYLAGRDMKKSQDNQ